MRPATKKNEKGMISVELGMLLPVLVLMLLALMDFGRLIWVRHVVVSAAAEGARMAVLHEPQNEDVSRRIRDMLAQGGVDAEPVIEIGARTPSQPVEVTVRVDFQYLVLSGFLDNAVGMKQIGATSRMMAER